MLIQSERKEWNIQYYYIICRIIKGLSNVITIVVDCGPDFGMLNNGRGVPVEGTTTFGSRVEFICDAGFTREGNQFRVCVADGSWSGNVPICEGMYI